MRQSEYIYYYLLPRHLHSARHMGIEAIATLDLARG
eukprot:COSAG06_NODE_44362_length_364_cov_0.615094_1_plen_35_part_01